MGRRHLLALLLGAVALVGGTTPSAAEVPDPSQWPAGAGLDPGIDTTAHSIRYAGPDRYQTNLALSLALRGEGDYPFDTPDPSSGGAAGLAAAGDWWGAGTCPRTVLVVAGDTFADALAASSLSDPTDRSDQPRLERVAAADPIFDPVGGFDRVDTAQAPVVVTTSARDGARTLHPAARLALTDLARGGCTLAREAVIVGGSTAVAPDIEGELVSLGYDEVFRVGGASRYETAARVATALGTGTPPPAGTPCADPRADDGSTRLGWYGNAVVEFRPSATECRLLHRTVVLADGGTGADALAAGWWTSRWQVPILLTAPDGSLPPATQAALQSLPVEAIVVLGGISRIPEATVEQARALTGAVTGRIAGSDRYATSVAMAQSFGGWHATGDGNDFAADLVCVAASSGSSANATGWPDALAAGPFCARLGGAASPGSPERALAPIDGGSGAVGGGARPSHDAVPVLLVPTGSFSLPNQVNRLVRDAFARETSWCSGRSAAEGCAEPGFAVALGGTAAVTDTAIALLAAVVGGGAYAALTDRTPRLDQPFVTSLDLSPVFTTEGASRSACLLAGNLADVRWLALAGGKSVDLLDDDRRAGHCLALGEEATTLVATSLSGHRATQSVDPTAEQVMLPEPIPQTGTRTDRPEGPTWSFTTGADPARSVIVAGDTAPIAVRTLDLWLRLTAGGRADATGSFLLDLPGGALAGQISGVAAAAGDGTWDVAGRAELRFSDGSRALGGFRAALSGEEGPGSASVSWSIDGVTE